MIGVLVNTGAVILGGAIGMLLKKGIPERIANIIMKAVALSVIYIGITGLMEGSNTLVLIISMIVGGVIGELLRLHDRLNGLGDKIQGKLKNSSTPFTEGFVAASLLFCVGAMAVVGSLKAGMVGDNSVLYSKSLLDFISAIIFASSLGGLGVMSSGVIVFLYQGIIAVLASFVAPYLGDAVISELTAVGSLLILGLGLNLLGVTKLKVMNFVPAIFIPILLMLIPYFGG